MSRDNVSFEKPEAVPAEGMSLAQQHEQATMDVQVATAQKIGRDIAAFQANLEKYATFSEEIAQECTYVLSKGGNKIIGPSIRFAELLMSTFRHLACDVYVVEEAFGYVKCGATVRDLFQNVNVRAEVRRNILKKDGKTRYSQDVIQSTVQAGQSLALRNAIIRIVPKALWQPIWLKSRDVAQGVDPKTGKPIMPFSERLERSFAKLKAVGVAEQDILLHVGKASRKEFDPDDLIYLFNKYQSIRAGEVDPDDAFPAPEEPEVKGGAEASEAEDRIRAAAAKKKASKKKAAKRKAKKKPEPEPEPEPDVEEPAEESEEAPVQEDGAGYGGEPPDDEDDGIPNVEL